MSWEHAQFSVDTSRRLQDHGAHARGLALPYGKQGILVTVDSNDPRKATKEAISVLEEVCSLQVVEPGARAVSAWPMRNHVARQSESA